MALARIEEFPNKEITLADFAKALSHPARIAILKTLAAKKECICGDLVLDLPLAQSTVSQHLKALKEAGLIMGEVDGPRSRYCINKKFFDRMTDLMQSFTESVSLKIKENEEKCL
jgi:ArsR family transcriptional regulator, arsenate/arsenite/antimonite-responsive transcriptional repressor